MAVKHISTEELGWVAGKVVTARAGLVVGSGSVEMAVAVDSEVAVEVVAALVGWAVGWAQ